jgi:hypothetical protein
MATNATRTLETFATTEEVSDEQSDDDCDCAELDPDRLPCFECFRKGGDGR